MSEWINPKLEAPSFQQGFSSDWIHKHRVKGMQPEHTGSFLLFGHVLLKVQHVSKTKLIFQTDSCYCFKKCKYLKLSNKSSKTIWSKKNHCLIHPLYYLTFIKTKIKQKFFPSLSNTNSPQPVYFCNSFSQKKMGWVGFFLMRNILFHLKLI